MEVDDSTHSITFIFINSDETLLQFIYTSTSVFVGLIAGGLIFSKPLIIEIPETRFCSGSSSIPKICWYSALRSSLG